MIRWLSLGTGIPSWCQRPRLEDYSPRAASSRRGTGIPSWCQRPRLEDYSPRVISAGPLARKSCISSPEIG